MDRFELKEKLGEGGMGAVYRALDKELGRVVAVKVIAMAVDAESIRRFQREMKLLSKLSHQNIIRVYDAGQTADGRGYFSMELIEGGDLDHRRKEMGPLPFDQAVPILMQTADALACIHAQGLLHRDIKPGNLMLENGGRLVVMDFGLVKDPTATMLTQEGRAVGTPRYMPPEVLAAREATGAVDVWALGITAHELLTGKQVYPVNSLPEMMDMIVNHPPPDLTNAVPGLPKWFLDLHYSTLSKSPADRPTAVQYRDGLKRRGAPGPSSGGTSTISKQRRALTTSIKVLQPTPTPLSSFTESLGSRAGRVAVAAVLLGVAGLAARVMAPRAPETPPTASASVAPSVEAAPSPEGIQPLEVRMVPPRRAVVQVAPALAVGATVLFNGTSRKAEGTPNAPNEAVFDDLPPGQELRIRLISGDGRELIVRTVKTPEPVRAGSVACHPTDDSVMLDFDIEVPRRLTVTIHRPGQEAPVASVTREAGQRWFHNVFTGLRPHTAYVARASDTSGWSALVNYPFETKRIEHRKALDLLLPNFVKSWSTSLYDVDALRAEPDPRTKPILKEILTKHDPLEVMDSRKLLWVIEELYDEELSGMLFDLYLKYSSTEISHEIFRGAYSGRHPALLRAAANLMERPSLGARRWLVHSAADAGGPEVCDRIAKVLEADPSWCDERSPYHFIRSDPARARTHLERWADKTVEPYHRWISSAALSILGDARAARTLGKVVRERPSPARGLAVRFLAAIPDPAACEELLTAFRAEPDDTSLSWGLAVSGDPRAADLFLARLAPSNSARIRHDAALCLAVLNARTPPVLTALRDALNQNPAEIAGAAAYALGELQDAPSIPALTTLATSDRDIEGFAALALARLKHKPVTAQLTAKLSDLCAKALANPPDARTWIRLSALAAALGELGDISASETIHTFEKLARLPRGCREMAKEALRRLARGTDPGETRVLVIPQVPAIRTPLTLYAGESVELSGSGVFSVIGGGPPAPAEIQTPAPGGARLGVAALYGASVMRVGRAPNRLLAEQPAHLLISAYDQFATSPLIPRDTVTGFALISVKR